MFTGSLVLLSVLFGALSMTYRAEQSTIGRLISDWGPIYRQFAFAGFCAAVLATAEVGLRSYQYDTLVASMGTAPAELERLRAENVKLKADTVDLTVRVDSLNDELNRRTLSLRPAEACTETPQCNVIISHRVQCDSPDRYPRLSLSEDTPQDFFPPPAQFPLADMETVERCVYYGLRPVLCW